MSRKVRSQSQHVQFRNQITIGDNDFDSNAKALITLKINDKRKKEYHSIRSYPANEAVQCYRDVHNNVDIHNQFLSYGHWDYRTRRKQMRVPIVIWFMKLYMLRLASRFSTHMLLSTPLLRGETSNSKTSQKKSAHIENTASDKHDWT